MPSKSHQPNAPEARPGVEPPEPRPIPSMRSFHRALIILTVVVVAGAAWAAQDFLVPTATAVVIAMALTPIVRALERLGLPTGLAAIVVVVLTGAILAGSAAMIAPSVSEWVKRAPQIAQTIEQKSRPLKEWLSTVQTATSKLEEVTQVQGGPNATVVPVQSSGGGMLEVSTQILGQTLYALALALFLITTRETYRKRLILLPTERANRLRVARIMNETLTQVSHYLFTMTLINIGVGFATAVAFMILGVPYAIAWGFLFGVASFIPYIGPTITIALCAVAQIVIAPTIEEAIAAPVALLVINFLEANFLTPWLLSRRLEVSSLAVFLAVAGLAWLWGPFAAILAVPLLIVFVAVARHVPGLEPWAVLLLADAEARSEVNETGRDRFFAEEQDMLEDDKDKSWARWVHDVAVGKAKRAA